MTFTNLGITEQMVANLIVSDSDSRPRSQQTNIGPSEIGTPCQRKLGYTILGTPKVNFADPLPSWIGTEAHAGMARILDNQSEHWCSEIPVEIPAYGIRGTADAFHRGTGTVCDWKFTSPAAIKKYRATGPGDQYRTQVHLYGLALSLAGWQVAMVAIAFIPRSGMTSGIHVWQEPIDFDVADAALRRLEAVGTVASALGAGALAATPTYCEWCPYFQPNSTDLTVGCPGA